MDADFTERDGEIMEHLAVAGALTARFLDGQYGPGWRTLVRRSYLRLIQTRYYGAVVVVTQRQRRQYARRRLTDHYPYISGPSSAANRAFQNDVLWSLEARGYTWAANQYKMNGRTGNDTDVIVSMTVRVPPDAAAHLARQSGPVAAQLPVTHFSQAVVLAHLGYPTVYVTVGATGGQIAR